MDELRTGDVADNLFSNFVISHDDLQRIHSKKTDKDKARCLIDILIRTENSFGPFLKEIESSRPDLVEKIMMTDVSEELNKGMLINTHFISFIMVWDVFSTYRVYVLKNLLLENMCKKNNIQFNKIVCNIIKYFQTNYFNQNLICKRNLFKSAFFFSIKST